ncbi:MAG: Xaa-Pro peptidase family protein [Chloroflexota bacterium]
MTQQRFFDWTSLSFSKNEYRQRRQKLQWLLEADDGVFLAPARQGFSDGTTFRQLNDFLYFTGLELPESMLVIDGGRSETILFVPKQDGRFSSPTRPNDFPGRPLASDPMLAQASGIGDIRPFSQLAPYLQQQNSPVYLNLGHRRPLEPLQTRFIQTWNPAETVAYHLQKNFPHLRLHNGYEHVAQLRMIKSAAEVAVMRRAFEITMDAIRVAAKAIRPGVDERTLEGIFESHCKQAGAQRLPFASIIKSGPNSLWAWRILASHYSRRNRTMQAGELVVFDVGCELDYYGSDMGRTFPVSGTFSSEQQDILDMQRVVLEGMITAVRPGVTLADIQAVAEQLIPKQAKPYMQVQPFFGHHIGLSPGDPSLVEAPLAPGMIITLEPWYYNHDKQLATFLEDAILVTETGFENLTVSLSKTAVDLEEMVSGGHDD